MTFGFSIRAGLGLAGMMAAAIGAAAAQTGFIPNVAYLGTDRPERLDVYLPARAVNDPPSPTVVWIHGGNWTGGGRADARAREVGSTLAAAGYACASVDYRLGPGAWPANLLDCKNAIRFLRAHASAFHIDRDRIAVMGASAGGQLALLVALTTGDRTLEPEAPYPDRSDAVSAAVDLCGIADPASWRPKPGSGFRPGGLEAMLGGSARAGPGRWTEASPVAHVAMDSPPVFIAQGLADPVVDPAQARELDRVLTSHGVAHRMVLLPGVGHAFDLTTWRGRPLPLDLRSQVLTFLRQYLGIAAHGLPVLPPAPSPRITIDLDPGWRFLPHDSDRGAAPGLNDSSWQRVDLPHTWNAFDGEDGGGNYRRGPSWYRRHLTVPSSLSGKRLYLQFDGACFQADVYVNGKHLGRHLGGFARFRFDATDALKTGQDNLIAVRVDNSPLGIIPVHADFTFFGGLYRPVSLIAVDPVQISMMDYASSGVFVTQERVTRERADLNIRAEIENYKDKDRKVEETTEILDEAGRRIAFAKDKVEMLSGDAFTVVQDISIANPHLWDGLADPYLYTVRVSLRAKGRLRDLVDQPLGIRYFRVDPNRGFFLNGHPLDLHGVNRHQDRIDEGWAISQADEAEDFALVRELGCTAVRSHYQLSQSWYDRCDRAGIVVWAEIPFIDDALGTDRFLDNAEDQLRELIRQDYNHPSICFWGVGNETQGKAADRILADLAMLAKTEDGTRLTTYASNAPPSDPRNGHTDVVAFNHYAGWYPGAGPISELPGFLDRTHAAHPGRAFGISEYGAGGSIFEHLLPPERPVAAGPFHPEEYETYFHERYWAALSRRPYLWCKLVFCMFDFASDGRNEGDHPGRNDKGLVTYDRRTRKDAFYFYKANWSPEPTVYIASGRFLVRHLPDTAVEVFSNAPEVELLLNGRSLGIKRGDAEHVFRWPDVELRRGDNAAAAIGHFGALTIADGCTWTYRPWPKRTATPNRGGQRTGAQE
ncbi:MAG: glycoside hydrolase family 2 TIM barrel-domain containing protein, partial [Opitutaceae bacterium]